MKTLARLKYTILLAVLVAAVLPLNVGWYLSIRHGCHGGHAGRSFWGWPECVR